MTLAFTTQHHLSILSFLRNAILQEAAALINDTPGRGITADWPHLIPWHAIQPAKG